jgi:hypothetical protein
VAQRRHGRRYVIDTRGETREFAVAWILVSIVAWDMDSRDMGGPGSFGAFYFFWRLDLDTCTNGLGWALLLHRHHCLGVEKTRQVG